jgi:hypothetical protein
MFQIKINFHKVKSSFYYYYIMNIYQHLRFPQNQIQYFTQFGHMAKLGESTFKKQKRINCQGK